VFAVNAAAGTLTMIGSPIPAAPAGYQPLAPFLNRRTNFLYVTASHASQPWLLAAFRFDAATGALTPLPGSPFVTNAATFVVPHPSGRFLYQATATSIQRFSIDPVSGVPTLQPSVTTPVEAGPYRIAQDPSGRYLYLTAAGATTVSAYSVDAVTGALTLVNTLPTGITPFPWWAGLQ
jgi:6-phosphogluconolactonase (cycloisomerase 2 family)